jgi:hypothetical protein
VLARSAQARQARPCARSRSAALVHITFIHAAPLLVLVGAGAIAGRRLLVP